MKDHDIRTVKSSAPDPGTVLSIGRLLSPAETDFRFGRYPAAERSRLTGRWVLCGQLAERSFDAFCEAPSHDIGNMMTVVSAGSGATFLVLTHQAASHQHRVVLPLWESKAQLFVGALTDSPYTCLLGRGGATPTLGIDILQSRELFTQLALSPIMSTSQQAANWARETQAFTETMCCINSLPSANSGVAVEAVSVTAILPRGDCLATDSRRIER